MFINALGWIKSQIENTDAPIAKFKARRYNVWYEKKVLVTRNNPITIRAKVMAKVKINMDKQTKTYAPESQIKGT